MNRFNTVDFIFASARPGDYPDHQFPEVAFIGRSNCGKSSLLNTVAGRKKTARVSSRPGCTRTINFFIVNNRFCITDLPGHGYAAAPESVRKGWRGLIANYLKRRENLKAVFFLSDVRRDYVQLDFNIVMLAGGRGIPVIPVATKVDKVSGNMLSSRLAALNEQFKYMGAAEVIPFSKRSGRGKREIIESITGCLKADTEQA